MKIIYVAIEVPSAGYCHDYNTKERCRYLCEDAEGLPVCCLGWELKEETTRGILKAKECA